MIREAHMTNFEKVKLMTPGFRRLQDIAIIIFKASYIRLDKSCMDVEILVNFLFLDTAQQLTGQIA